MHSKLSPTVSEDGEAGFKKQNTMDVRMSILKGLKHSTTGDLAELLSHVSHKPIEFYANVSPSSVKRAELDIIGQGYPQRPRRFCTSVSRTEKDQILRIPNKTSKPTIDTTAIDVITTFRTLHSEVLSLEIETLQTVFMEALRPSKNHIFVLRNPRNVTINDLRNRIAILNVVSEKSSKRRHKPSKQSASHVTTKKKGRCGRYNQSSGPRLLVSRATPESRPFSFRQIGQLARSESHKLMVKLG
jgi:hypothetical protein